MRAWSIISTCHCGIVFSTKKKLIEHKRSCLINKEISRQNRKDQALKNLILAEKFKKENPGVVQQRHKKAMEKYEYSERELKIRSETMKRVNNANKEKFNKTRSENAKRTAARPDIIVRRSEKLKAWRDANPEVFKEITRKAQSSPKKCFAEKILHKDLLEGLGFQHSDYVECLNSTKQVDFVNKELKFWIELDGNWHFGSAFFPKKYKTCPFERIHFRDMLLCNEAIKRQDVTLVRLGLDCWRGAGKRILKDEWETALLALIQNPKPGVWLFGKLYRQGLWAYDTCTTWKYVTHPITLPFLMGQ